NNISICINSIYLHHTLPISHLIQQPPSWFVWPSRPAGLYRVTQGLHVATGIASIPLLLAKLWTVYPLLWTWPPARNVAHAVERRSEEQTSEFQSLDYLLCHL